MIKFSVLDPPGKPGGISHESFITALSNNKFGWAYMPADVRRIYTEDLGTSIGIMLYDGQEWKEEKIEIDSLPDNIENVNDLVQKGQVEADIIMHKGKCSLLIRFSDEDDDNEQKDEYRMDSVLKRFFSDNGIDTLGKLKTAVRIGEEMFQEWCEENKMPDESGDLLS